MTEPAHPGETNEEGRVYALFVVYSVLLIAAFFTPRFAGGKGEGFGNVAEAFLFFMGFGLAALFVALVTFVFTWRRRAQLAAFPRRLGLALLPVTAAAAIAFYLYIVYDA